MRTGLMPGCFLGIQHLASFYVFHPHKTVLHVKGENSFDGVAGLEIIPRECVNQLVTGMAWAAEGKLVGSALAALTSSGPRG